MRTTEVTAILLCCLSEDTVLCADVDSMMGLLSSWLGTAIGSGAVVGSSEAAAESREDIGGLSQVLAEILASLQNNFAGTPLDVEISYEGLSEVSPPPYSSRECAIMQLLEAWLALICQGSACCGCAVGCRSPDWCSIVLQGEDTEIDIEIDPELVPVLEPQFLDEKLQALSQKWSG